MIVTSFLINSGSMIITDPCKMFGNDGLILSNVVNGRYIMYIHYNNRKEIIFVRAIHAKYAYSDNITTVDLNTDDGTIFCVSTRLGVFDSNVFTENIVTQEFKNQFYDLCCSVSSNDYGYGIIEDCCFIGCFVLDNYKIRLIVNKQNEIVGVRIGLIKDVKNIINVR